MASSYNDVCNKNKKRVCIIGAGPAGLAALRHVLQSPNLTGKLFEASNTIGGIWAYSDMTPMYKNLRYGCLDKLIMGHN